MGFGIFLHILHLSLALQDLDKSPFSRQPKQTPFDLKKAIHSCALCFMNSTHSSRLWLLQHIRQCADGQIGFWPASSPVEVTRVLADGGCLMRNLNGKGYDVRSGTMANARKNVAYPVWIANRLLFL